MEYCFDKRELHYFDVSGMADLALYSQYLVVAGWLASQNINRICRALFRSYTFLIEKVGDEMQMGFFLPDYSVDYFLFKKCDKNTDLEG